MKAMRTLRRLIKVSVVRVVSVSVTEETILLFYLLPF